jgi:hypothetical protein
MAHHRIATGRSNRTRIPALTPVVYGAVGHAVRVGEGSRHGEAWDLEGDRVRHRQVDRHVHRCERPATQPLGGPIFFDCLPQITVRDDEVLYRRGTAD